MPSTNYPENAGLIRLPAPDLITASKAPRTYDVDGQPTPFSARNGPPARAPTDLIVREFLDRRRGSDEDGGVDRVGLGGRLRGLGPHPARDADDDGVRRHVADDDRVRANLRAGTDRDRAEDAGPGADGDAVADGRVPLLLGHRAATQGGAVVKHHVVADLGRLTDDHTHPVVDEEASSDAGPGVDLSL